MLAAISPPPLEFYGLLLLPVIACLTFCFGRDIASRARWRIGPIMALLLGAPAAALVIMLVAVTLDFWLYRQIRRLIASSGLWPGFERDHGRWLFWISYCMVVLALCIGVRAVRRRLRRPTS